MKGRLCLFTILTAGMTGLADPSVMADIQEFCRLRWESAREDISQKDLEDSWDRQKKIKVRAEPVLHREFAKLADGELTPLVRDLLKESGDIWVWTFCTTALHAQMPTYSVDVQAKVLEKVFDTVPDLRRGRVLRSFVTDLPKEAFAGKAIQQWLVDTINGGISGGGFYFILTEESVRAVSKAVTADMKKFSKEREHSSSNLLSLMSAVFLASRGDDDAVALLDSLLDRLDINSLLDTVYVIPAAAMPGNEKLIKKIINIAVMDKRVRINGEDCIPKETSFAHEAAKACALVIEGFPAVVRYKYDDEAKGKVRQWIEANPAYTLKAYTPRVFLKEHFNNIIPAMRRVMEKE